MASFLHIMWNNSVSLSATGGLPALQIYAGIASDPGALPDDRGFIAFTVSETVGSSSSSGLHSTCGSLLIASSLIDDGRLRTPSKCSAHLYKIASLSVRRLVPSALRSGVVPELWGPYTVLSASKNFSCPFCLQRTGFHQPVFSARSLACLWASSELSCICLNRQSC